MPSGGQFTPKRNSEPRGLELLSPDERKRWEENGLLDDASGLGDSRVVLIKAKRDVDAALRHQVQEDLPSPAPPESRAMAIRALDNLDEVLDNRFRRDNPEH